MPSKKNRISAKLFDGKLIEVSQIYDEASLQLKIGSFIVSVEPVLTSLHAIGIRKIEIRTPVLLKQLKPDTI